MSMHVDREVFVVEIHTGLSFVFTPRGDRTVGVKSNNSASGAFAPNAARAFDGKPVNDAGPQPRRDRVVDLKTPARSIAKKAREVVDNRVTADERSTPGFAIFAVIAEMRCGAKRIAAAPRVDQAVERFGVVAANSRHGHILSLAGSPSPPGAWVARSATSGGVIIMLGRLDSNQRMPESKSGALPTWLRPNSGQQYRLASIDSRLRRPFLDDRCRAVAVAHSSYGARKRKHLSTIGVTSGIAKSSPRAARAEYLTAIRINAAPAITSPINPTV